MHINEMHIENFKRVVDVRIKPAALLVEIAGRNGQGKTSVLDALWVALSGKAVAPAQPIREGATEARIQLQLGEDDTPSLVVTRTFRRRDDHTYTTKLTVESADGAVFRSPQEMLDRLIGSLSFDPLAFVRMPPKLQVQELRSLIPGVDFDALDRANAADYDARTEVGRQGKAIKAQIDGLKIPGDPRLQRVDESALIAELEAAGAVHAQIAEERARREHIGRDAEDLAQKHRDELAQHRTVVEEIARLEQRIEMLRQMAAQHVRTADTIKAQRDELLAELAALPPLPEPPDTTEIKARIDAARATNAAVAERENALARRAVLEKEHAALAEKWTELTDRIQVRQAEMRDAISNARLPIDGLGFNADTVLFNGLPLDQASDAERLRVAVAIAAAKNPTLRVIRVRDGSLLDDDGVRLLAQFAEEHDMQVWIERVAKEAKNGVVIEDGRILEQAEAAA